MKWTISAKMMAQGPEICGMCELWDLFRSRRDGRAEDGGVEGDVEGDEAGELARGYPH